MIRSTVYPVALLAAFVVCPLTSVHGQTVPGAAPAAKQWPVLIKDASPSVADAAKVGWSAQEIKSGRAQCARVLAAYHIVAEHLDPIHDGDCGTPAPVSVTSIGKSPAVQLSSPAILNCDMLETFAKWLKSDVQPRARSLLGAPVDKIHVMSSYSCRKAYGRKRGRLSEHASANAIDIGSFATAKGQEVALLDDWGMTERDIKARIAAAKAAARKHETAAAAIQPAPRPATSPPPVVVAEPGLPPPLPTVALTTGSTPAPSLKSGQEAAIPQQPAAIHGFRTFVSDAMRQIVPMDNADPARTGTGLTLGQPSRLGGPKVAKKPEASVTPASAANRRQFLHDLHETACKRFGTVLGPEANAAHRNHFHLDRAERPRGNYCE